MGILISLIYLPFKSINERRDKKRAQKVAGNYSSQSAPAPTQPESQALPAPRTSQEPHELLSTPSASEQHQELQQREQLQTEINSTVGAARVGFPAAVSAGPSAAAGGASNDPPQPSTVPAPTPAARAGKMATDEEYMAFLDKANADLSAGTAQAAGSGGGKVQLKTVDRGAEIPQVLKAPTEKQEWVYVSDADEPFIAVSLRLEGGRLPDEETFARLIEHPDPAGAAVEILDVVQWDSRGEYREVVEACRKAAMGGDVRVYRVKLGGTRVEYWVVAVEGQSKRKGEGARLVGVKALAVES